MEIRVKANRVFVAGVIHLVGPKIRLAHSLQFNQVICSVGIPQVQPPSCRSTVRPDRKQRSVRREIAGHHGPLLIVFQVPDEGEGSKTPEINFLLGQRTSSSQKHPPFIKRASLVICLLNSLTGKVVYNI